MTKTKQSKIKRWIPQLAAACLVLAVVGGGLGWSRHQANAVTGVVSLDVNPSIELRINAKQRVVAVDALNEKAVAVIDDMDLKDVELKVAVNALVGAMLQKGYLDVDSDAILISVEDKDTQRAHRLELELAGTVDETLKQAEATVTVHSQTVEVDEERDEKAKQSSISTGKAALVERICALNDQLDFDALAELSVEELEQLLRTGAPAMPVGKAAVLELVQGLEAYKHITRWDIEPELDEKAPHYEAESEQDDTELWVDAYTGQLIYEEPDGNTPAQQTGKPEKPDKPDKPDKDELLDPEQIKQLALAHAGVSADQVSEYESELDRDDGRLEYEVEFKANGVEYEYTLDAYTGQILEREADRDDDDDDDDDDRPGIPAQGRLPGVEGAPGQADKPEKEENPEQTPAQPDKLSAARARDIALAHAGVTVQQMRELKVDLDRDDGRLEYEIEFKADGVEYEYTLDALTGDILDYEIDRDDDHDEFDDDDDDD